MEKEIVSLLALSRIEGIGPARINKLLKHFGTAGEVLRADRLALEQTNLPAELIDAILQIAGFDDLQSELRYLKNHGIRVLPYFDPDYPRRLSRMQNAPAILQYRGNASLNAKKIVAVAGTRSSTEYGDAITAQFIGELSQPDLLVLSGLAFGIDAAAHHAALRSGIPTVGVLGSGLGQVYPSQHWGLARSMTKQGGILSAAPCHAKASIHSFPIRNHLIAALCDVMVVMETRLTGGTFSAVDAAVTLGVPVFAAPGRLNDEKSLGCLSLIHEKKASLLLSAGQLSAAMAWRLPAGDPTHQPDLPFDLPRQPAPPNQRRGRSDIDEPLLAMLRERETVGFDELLRRLQQPMPALSSSLFELELCGKIRALPGSRYCLA